MTFSWTLRKWRNVIRGRVAERLTGRPAWVLREGIVIACPHEYTSITGWCLNLDNRVWPGPTATAEEFIDRLVLAMPDCVRHEPLPDLCTFCEGMTR